MKHQFLCRAALLGVAVSGGLAGAATSPFKGPWLPDAVALTDLDHQAPPLLAEAKAQQEKNAKALNSLDDPDGRCLPPGPTRVLTQKNMPFDLIVGKRDAVFLYQFNRNYRAVYLNANHWDGIGPEYFGQAVAKLEGNSLVIDGNQYNDTTWLDDSGLPHSDQLHTVERWTPSADGKTLTAQITIEDAKTFSKPWTTQLTFKKAPAGTIVQEDFCFHRLGLDKANIVSTQ